MRKLGGRNEISDSSATALGRLQARTVTDYVADRLMPALDLPERAPALFLVEVYPEDDVGVSGTLLFLQADAGLLQQAVVERLDEARDAASLRFEFQGRPFTCAQRGRLVACTRISLLTEARLERAADAVNTAIIERACDELVRVGRIDYGEHAAGHGEIAYRHLSASGGAATILPATYHGSGRGG